MADRRGGLLNRAKNGMTGGINRAKGRVKSLFKSSTPTSQIQPGGPLPDIQQGSEPSHEQQDPGPTPLPMLSGARAPIVPTRPHLSSQRGSSMVAHESTLVSPVPQVPHPSYFERAHHIAVQSLSPTHIGRDQVNYITNIQQCRQDTGDYEKPKAEIREWLKAPRFVEVHRASMELRTDETGTWFIESSEFQQFIGNSGCILWCTGMPGAGKTILASTSIKHLQTTFRNDVSVAVVYAYLRYNESYPLREIFASLLDQLLVHDSVVVKIESSYRQMKEDGVKYTTKELISVLKNVVPCLSRVFAVIDGLDEAADDVKDGLLEALPTIGANLLIFSRPLELYSHHTPQALQVSIQARTADIALYINEQFKKNSRLRALLGGRRELASELSHRIKSQANGMFLLARLQLEAVMRNSSSAKSLFESLEKLPSGIDAMYLLTLERINSQPEELLSVTQRLFVWLLHQVSPLTLEDLQYALAVSVDGQPFNMGSIVPAELILSACHGLVVVSKNRFRRDTFRFIHYSAKEFLKTAQWSTVPHPQAYLASTCVAFLDQHRDLIKLTQLPTVPFLRYTSTHWGQHAELSQRSGEPLHPIIISSLSTHSLYPLQGLMVPSLSAAAVHGLVDVIKSKLLAFPPLWPGTSNKLESSVSHIFATPFNSAAYGGHFDAFLALLSTYGTQNLPIWTSKDPSFPTIIHVAARSEAPNAVSFLQMLLAIVDSPPTPAIRLALSEFDINAQDNSGVTPLMLACLNPQDDIPRFLVSRQDIKIDLRDSRGLSAFHIAAGWPEHDRAQLLLSAFPYLNVETTDDAGNTPFLAACTAGQARVVEGILTNRSGTDRARLVHQANLKGTTPLIAAVQGPLPRDSAPAYGAIVRLLLDHGSDLHARQVDDGMTAFLRAVVGRKSPTDTPALITYILKPLLAFEPSVIEQCDSHGRTVLMLEARGYFNRGLIDFLVSSHPDPKRFVHQRDHDGRSALMHTIDGPNVWTRLPALRALSTCPFLDVRSPIDRMGRGILEVLCADKYFGLHPYPNPEMFFSALYTILDITSGLDARFVRKAVIAGVRSLPSILIYRLLTEDWVVHSFIWSLDEPDTVALLVQAATRNSTCQAPVSIVLYRLGLLEPSVLPQGIVPLDFERLVDAFCHSPGPMGQQSTQYPHPPWVPFQGGSTGPGQRHVGPGFSPWNRGATGVPPASASQGPLAPTSLPGPFPLPSNIGMLPRANGASVGASASAFARGMPVHGGQRSKASMEDIGIFDDDSDSDSSLEDQDILEAARMFGGIGSRPPWATDHETPPVAVDSRIPPSPFPTPDLTFRDSEAAGIFGGGGPRPPWAMDHKAPPAAIGNSRIPPPFCLPTFNPMLKDSDSSLDSSDREPEVSPPQDSGLDPTRKVPCTCRSPMTARKKLPIVFASRKTFTLSELEKIIHQTRSPS